MVFASSSKATSSKIKTATADNKNQSQPEERKMKASSPSPSSSSSSANKLEETYTSLIQQYLSILCYENATFLAERLHATFPSSQHSIYLLSICYYRQNQPWKVYTLLKQSNSLALSKMSSDLRYLMAKCCLELFKYREAEQYLLPHPSERPGFFKLQFLSDRHKQKKKKKKKKGNKSKNDDNDEDYDDNNDDDDDDDDNIAFEKWILSSSTEQPSPIPNGAAGLYLLGVIARKSHRNKTLAKKYFYYSLKLDPLMWCSWEALCELGCDDVDVMHNMRQKKGSGYQGEEKDARDDVTLKRMLMKPTDIFGVVPPCLQPFYYNNHDEYYNQEEKQQELHEEETYTNNEDVKLPHQYGQFDPTENTNEEAGNTKEGILPGVASDSTTTTTHQTPRDSGNNNNDDMKTPPNSSIRQLDLSFSTPIHPSVKRHQDKQKLRDVNFSLSTIKKKKRSYFPGEEQKNQHDDDDTEQQKRNNILFGSEIDHAHGTIHEEEQQQEDKERMKEKEMIIHHHTTTSKSSRRPPAAFETPNLTPISRLNMTHHTNAGDNTMIMMNDTEANNTTTIMNDAVDQSSLSLLDAVEDVFMPTTATRERRKSCDRKSGIAHANHKAIANAIMGHPSTGDKRVDEEGGERNNNRKRGGRRKLKSSGYYGHHNSIKKQLLPTIDSDTSGNSLGLFEHNNISSSDTMNEGQGDKSFNSQSTLEATNISEILPPKTPSTHNVVLTQAKKIVGRLYYESSPLDKSYNNNNNNNNTFEDPYYRSSNNNFLEDSMIVETGGRVQGDNDDDNDNETPSIRRPSRSRRETQTVEKQKPIDIHDATIGGNTTTEDIIADTMDTTTEASPAGIFKRTGSSKRLLFHRSNSSNSENSFSTNNNDGVNISGRGVGGDILAKIGNFTSNFTGGGGGTEKRGGAGRLHGRKKGISQKNNHKEEKEKALSLTKNDLPVTGPTATKTNKEESASTKATIVKSTSLVEQKETATPDEESIHHILSLLCHLGTAYKLLCNYQCQPALQILHYLSPDQYETGWVQHQIGKSYFEMADYPNAVLALQRMMETDPSRVKGLDILSTSLWHLRKEVQLSTLAQHCVEFLDSQCPETWCVVGNCFSLQKEHETALRFFRRSIQIDPQFTYSYTLSGHEYVANEDFHRAAQCYRDALRVDENHYNAWYGLGSIYYQQEKYDLAEYHYKKALSINPQSSVLYCHLGMAQYANSKAKDALQTLDYALMLDPGNVQARFQKANIFMSFSSHQGGVGGEKKSNNNNDNNNVLLLQKALHELQKVSDSCPREASVHHSMGKVCKKLGWTGQAMKCYLTAMDLDPKDNNMIKTSMDRLFDGSNSEQGESEHVLNGYDGSEEDLVGGDDDDMISY